MHKELAEKLIATNRVSGRFPCPKCSHTRKKVNQSDPCMRLTLDEQGAVWYCHHCHDRGSMVIEHKGLNRGKRSNNDLETITPPKDELSPEALDYLLSRSITEATAKQCDVVSRQQYFRGGGEMEAIGFQYFLPEKKAPIGVKWRSCEGKNFSFDGTAKTFWNLTNINPDEPILIVEGELDALSCIEAGWPNVLSVPSGASNATEASEIEFLWRSEDDLRQCPKVIIGLDMDEPGEAFANELARRIGRVKCFKVEWPEKDANATLDINGPSTVIKAIEDAEPWPVAGLYSVSHYQDEVKALFENGREPGLDPELGLLREVYTIAPGQITIVTGVPSSGKSEFIDQIAVNMAVYHGWNIGIWSAENPTPEHIGKLVEKKVQKPFFSKLFDRMDSGELEEAISWLNRHFFFIDTEGDNNSIDNILDKAEVAVLRSGIKGLILDPYNYLEIDRSMSETEYVSGMLTKVRKFAMNYDVHVWFVAHPSKLYRENGKQPIPTGYDIAGSAHWFNKTDVGMTVHRTEANQTEVHIWKCRFKWIGQKGHRLFDYDISTGCYTAGFDYGEETTEIYVKD